MSANSVWSLRDVRFRHHGASSFAVDGVTLEIASGRMTAILGPNGAGKSTLLNLLLGTAAPASGSIAFKERSIADWERRALALDIGVVPQGETEPLFTVREIVAMGRYPHLGPWQRERAEDLTAIARAMDRCDIAQFSDRWISTLSGGERQRVRLARALAQEPSVLVLDEPTTFLDIRHEMTTFELLRRLRDEGATILLVTHNINLAARYADELVLMDRGRVAAHGSPASVLTEDRVAAVYEWPISIVAHDENGHTSPQVMPKEAAR
ncbi:MAG TPA: ABC transporter ATP-binding protein [Gemmatimonadaceae bacterium]